LGGGETESGLDRLGERLAEDDEEEEKLEVFERLLRGGSEYAGGEEP